MNVKLLPKNSKYLVLNIRVSFERFEGSDFWFRNSCFTIIRFPFYLRFIMGFCFKSGSKWFMTISWKLVSVLLVFQNGSKKELVFNFFSNGCNLLSLFSPNILYSFNSHLTWSFPCCSVNVHKIRKHLQGCGNEIFL